MHARSIASPLLAWTLLTTSLFAAASLPAQTRPQDRIAAHPDLTASVPLAGHIPIWANAAADAGPVDASLPLDHLVLLLQRDPETEAAFQQLLVDQQDPRSPRYHHWLTPTESGRLYGATPHDIAAVTSWLTTQGLRVDEVSPTGISITFSGSTGAIARALATEFRSFQRNGTAHYSLAKAPSVPAALAPVIGSVIGLSEEYFHNHGNFQTVPMPATTGVTGAHPAFTNGPTHLISPKDFAVLYDINLAYNTGFNGAGYRIAVIGGSRVTVSDVTTFESLSGLAANTPNLVILPSGSDPGPTANSAQSEATLDVDRVLATAPGAPVDLLVTTNSLLLTNTLALLNYEIGTLNDPIVNMSFGACEAGVGTNTTAFNTVFATGAAQGITWVASSGDSGATGCDTPFVAATGTQVLSADFICASSYVTCVGGTQLVDTINPGAFWASTNSTSLYSLLSYIPEGAWNESGSPQVAGTGGGVSTVIPKPSWQVGVGVPADGFRDTPDVAFSAANHDGYFGCLAFAGADCVSTLEIFSGTSASAPGMAGIMALVDQKLGTRQGNFNPTIYRLAASPANGIFHDATPASSGVTTCSTSVVSLCNNTTTPGLAGYGLQTGYDQATGWGSIDVGKLVASLTAVASGFGMAASPASLTLSAGSTTGNTSLLTFSALGGFSGTVGQTCVVAYTGSGTVNYIPTCTLSSASVAVPANASGTATITIGSTIPHLLASGKPVAGSSPAPFDPRLDNRQDNREGNGGIPAVALSLLALSLLPRSRLRRAFAGAGSSLTLLTAALLFAGIAGLSGCGGAKPAATVTAAPVLVGTTTGGYTVTITGISGSITANTTIALTIQ